MQGDGSTRIRSTVAAAPNAIKTNNTNDIGAKKSINVKKTDGNGNKNGFFSKIISCFCCPTNESAGPELG
jgi:hypothetical protein